jgi:hypothetical protein
MSFSLHSSDCSTETWGSYLTLSGWVSQTFCGIIAVFHLLEPKLEVVCAPKASGSLKGKQRI